MSRPYAKLPPIIDYGVIPLINLIVAQRNYQANAKTIQTEDAVTQAIINLR